MRTSILPSVLFVLLGLHVCIPTASAESKCDKTETIEIVKDKDYTKEEAYFYTCASSMANKVVNVCYVHLKPNGEKSATGSHFMYSADSKEDTVIFDFTMTMEENQGVYSFASGDRKAKGYITKVSSDGKCLTYFKCYSGGSWGGAASEGQYAAILCSDPNLCDGEEYKELEQDITDNYLSGDDKLEKFDQAKCASKGLKPQ